MDNWIRWAFEQQLGTGEKLVLVYLASLVGAAGVGRYRREDLADATDYEPRSLQRILKNLRDAGHLQDTGDWFSLRGAVSPQDMPPADLQLSPPPSASLLSPSELEGAGEHLAAAITEAANAHLARLNDVTMRMLQGIEHIAIAAREHELAAPAPPPPDPVRESTHFKAFMLGGLLSEEEAYDLAKKRLEAEGQLVELRGATAVVSGPQTITMIPTKPPKVRDMRQYLDSALGRFERVRDILDPAGADPWADAMTVWQRLEDLENKHTVEGETDAFELLYPAIVTAARRSAGHLKLEPFLKAAPWDNAPASAPDKLTLTLETNRMLEEIEQANHPMCQVNARTVEKNEGGPTYVESDEAFFTRVKRVHEQLKKLQQMGV